MSQEVTENTHNRYFTIYRRYFFQETLCYVYANENSLMKFISSFLYHLVVNLFNLLILECKRTIYFEKELLCLKGKLEHVADQIIQTSSLAFSLRSIISWSITFYDKGRNYPNTKLLLAKSLYCLKCWRICSFSVVDTNMFMTGTENEYTQNMRQIYLLSICYNYWSHILYLKMSFLDPQG